MLLAGGDNLERGGSPEHAVAGVRAIAAEVRDRLPGARLLVLGILPAEQQPTAPLRTAIGAANRMLEPLTEPGRVLFIDVGGALLAPDETLDIRVMSDFHAPTPLGYDLLSQSVGLVAEGLLRGSL
jgi:hypothetical protein